MEEKSDMKISIKPPSLAPAFAPQAQGSISIIRTNEANQVLH